VKCTSGMSTHLTAPQPQSITTLTGINHSAKGRRLSWFFTNTTYFVVYCTDYSRPDVVRWRCSGNLKSLQQPMLVDSTTTVLTVVMPSGMGPQETSAVASHSHRPPVSCPSLPSGSRFPFQSTATSRRQSFSWHSSPTRWSASCCFVVACGRRRTCCLLPWLCRTCWPASARCRVSSTSTRSKLTETGCRTAGVRPTSPWPTAYPPCSIPLPSGWPWHWLYIGTSASANRRSADILLAVCLISAKHRKQLAMSVGKCLTLTITLTLILLNLSLLSLTITVLILTPRRNHYLITTTAFEKFCICLRYWGYLHTHTHTHTRTQFWKSEDMVCMQSVRGN